jgi:hypothetical protein
MKRKIAARRALLSIAVVTLALIISLAGASEALASTESGVL